MKRRLFLLSCVVALSSLFSLPAHAAPRWTPAQANAWYRKTGWLVGCNFIPSTAVNELEMWQADTFDLPTIDRELGLAEGLGFNSVRVFLHNLPWEQDSEGFSRRIDQFLTVAHKHHIGVLFVLLDSCWDPYPQLGKQRAPKPHLHNSGWVQAPGKEILSDPAKWDSLKPYIQGVLKRFGKDSRVQYWDLMNEPDNTNGNSYGKQEPPNKAELGFGLLKKVYEWAKEANPRQPITSAPWKGDWSSSEKMAPIDRFQIEESDVITFHNYGPLPDMQKRVEWLKRYGRPVICTEYMARGAGSTFDTVLPIARQYHVGAINWGLVNGKTQTDLPWDSWQHPYVLSQPTIWFHDIFHTDGTPYKQDEVDLIRRITGAKGVK